LAKLTRNLEFWSKNFSQQFCRMETFENSDFLENGDILGKKRRCRKDGTFYKK